MSAVRLSERNPGQPRSAQHAELGMPAASQGQAAVVSLGVRGPTGTGLPWKIDTRRRWSPDKLGH